MSRPPLQRDSQKVSAMFGRIAPWYDFLNHFLSLGIDRRWRKKLIQALALQQGRILDLAAGTLDVSLGVLKASPQLKVVAADISLPMLIQGKKKFTSSNCPGLICANGLQLPLRSNSIQGVTIAFGIRNIVPRTEAYAEILRILKPRGRLCILEFGSGQKKIWGGIYNLYLQKALPWLGGLISKDKGAYDYLAQTILEFPPVAKLKQELLDAGFAQVTYQELNSGIVCLHTACKGP